MLKRFEVLRERLLCAGVAPRHAHRYLRELQEHFADLVDEGTESSLARSDAEARAMERLGTTEVLAQAMIERPHFRALSAKAPVVVYILAPPIALALCFVGSILLILAAHMIYQPSTGGHVVPPSWFAALVKGLGWLTAFVVPILLGWSIAMLAIRQRAGPLWPAFGITVIAVLGAAAQLNITLPTGGGGHGEIDIDSVFLPPFAGVQIAAVHAGVNLLANCIPYLITISLSRARPRPSDK